MKTQFRKVVLPAEIRSLVVFDHKAFCDYPGDWFDREAWRRYESWWMIIDSRKIGCCAFERNVDFQDDVGQDGRNPELEGSLYVASTGILPAFRRLGFGNLMKCWQISYARQSGFYRIVTNTRKSNKPMIGVNKRFGFKIIRTTAGYYSDPSEATVVMELSLRPGLKK